MASTVPSLAAEAVLVQSEEMPSGSETVRGFDFNAGVDYHGLLRSYRYSGFQATNFGLAVEEINKMIEMRRKPIQGQDPQGQVDEHEEDEHIRRYSISSPLISTQTFLTFKTGRSFIRQHLSITVVPSYNISAQTFLPLKRGVRLSGGKFVTL